MQTNNDPYSTTAYASTYEESHHIRKDTQSPKVREICPFQNHRPIIQKSLRAFHLSFLHIQIQSKQPRIHREKKGEEKMEAKPVLAHLSETSDHAIIVAGPIAISFAYLSLSTQYNTLIRMKRSEVFGGMFKKVRVRDVKKVMVYVAAKTLAPKCQKALQISSKHKGHDPEKKKKVGKSGRGGM
jgi:hypothetical protein